MPSGLSNVVAIAAGAQHGLALQSNGIVISWGNNLYGQTNVPTGMSNVMAIAGGSEHSLALRNNGTVASWGNNTYGQTNTIMEGAGVAVRSIAAGGNHSVASLFSSSIQYPVVDLSKELLLIYNSNSVDSSNVCAYYLAHRPMAANANALGINCESYEDITATNYTNEIAVPIQGWLSNNPTKRPSYVILFQDVPSRTYYFQSTNFYAGPGVQVRLNSGCVTNWHPFITSINMNGLGGTNDCIAYIDKLAYFGANYSLGQVILSASGGGYANTNWYFDDTSPEFGPSFLYEGVTAVLAVNSNTSIIYNADTNPATLGTLAGHITNASNVAAFSSFGLHGYTGDTNGGYATNGTILFTGQSGWYIVQTIESFNGQRDPCCNQGNFLSWYAANAFNGTNYNSYDYTNTPVGAVSTVEEPYFGGNGFPAPYFGSWAAGKNFAFCAWTSISSSSMQAVGDPLVRK